MVGADVQRRLDAYVPPIALRLISEPPGARVRTLDATVVFADISGFTRLSERLARSGREGAEELTETIGGCLGALLAVAHENGGELVKLGGDALLLLFYGEGHTVRACRAALDMRRRLRDVGRLHTSAGSVTLRMSQGVHSGEFHLFLAGESHRELLMAGPSATTVVSMESAAGAGEVLLSPATATRLPDRCAGAVRGPGVLLASSPLAPSPPGVELAEPPAETVARCLSTAMRAHLAAGPQQPEHRTATVAFLGFEGMDELIAREGPEAASAALHELVTLVQRAIDDQEVCFLESDVGADGGKLMLTAGAPRIAGDDEERMLLALRRVMEAELPVPVRVGVNRGGVFSGDLTLSHRRSYRVMGDAVNLAARLMAKAPHGEIFASSGPLDRSPTRFALTELEPFKVKGKRRPVQAWSVGPAIGSRAREKVPERFPLVGREREVAALEDALASARAGAGRLVEIVGEPGIGKHRLIEELRDRAPDLPRLHATCEAYTASIPYVAWRELLRHSIGAGWDDPDEVVLERLRVFIEDPELEPWIPLLAIALDAEAPPTPEVEALADDFRSARLHEVVIAFLRQLLTRPVLLEFHDAQLMDHASADLLAAVARAVSEAPWLVAVTRTDSGSGFAAEAQPAVVRLEPAPLGSEETLALAEAVTESSPLPPHVVKLAAERSGGSPQFLRDLLRAAEADGGAGGLPESIEAAAMARMDQLSPDDRALIRRAAVLGSSFHPRFLADVLDPDMRRPDERTWERLWRYFELDEDGYMRFRRPVVRDAAYDSLPFRTRRRLHSIVGEHLERDAADDLDEHAAILSLHFARAGRQAEAWRYARRAADRASARFAPADAAILYRRALDAARTLGVAGDELADVWEALGAARAHTGEPAAAADAFTAARRLVAGDPVRTAELLYRHARLSLHAGWAVTAVRWCQRGLRMLAGIDGRRAAACRAHLTATLATVRQRQGRMNEAISLCRAAITEAESAGADAALANACFILDWALVESGRAGEAVNAERARQIYAKLGHLDREASVLNNMGGFAYRDGRWDEAVVLYRRGAELYRRAGDVGSSAYGDCNVAEVLSDQGRLEDAEMLLKRARRIWRSTGHDWGVASVDALLGRVAVRAGRHDEGVMLLREARLAFQKLRTTDDVVWVRALLVEANALSGDAEDAAREADALLASLPTGTRLAALLQRARGLAFAQLGDLGRAQYALEASLAEARRQGEDYEVAATLEALARVSRREPPDRRGEREALLRRLDIVELPAVSPRRTGAAVPT